MSSVPAAHEPRSRWQAAHARWHTRQHRWRHSMRHSLKWRLVMVFIAARAGQHRGVPVRHEARRADRLAGLRQAAGGRLRGQARRRDRLAARRGQGAGDRRAAAGDRAHRWAAGALRLASGVSPAAVERRRRRPALRPAELGPGAHHRRRPPHHVRPHRPAARRASHACSAGSRWPRCSASRGPPLPTCGACCGRCTTSARASRGSAPATSPNRSPRSATTSSVTSAIASTAWPPACRACSTPSARCCWPSATSCAAR